MFNVETLLPHLFNKPVQIEFLYKAQNDLHIAHDDEDDSIIMFVIPPTTFTALSEGRQVVNMITPQIIGKMILVDGIFYITYESMFNNTISMNESDSIFKLTKIFQSFFSNQTLFNAIVNLLGFTQDQQNEVFAKIFKLDEDKNIEIAINNFTSGYVRDMQQISSDIDRIQKDSGYYRKEIQKNNAKIATLIDNYTLFNESNFMNKVRTEFHKIANHPRVIATGVEDNYYVVYTNDLYILEPIHQKRYYLGAMKIMLPFVFDEKNFIRLLNVNNTRHGYWENSPHPHISSSGVPCFGNIDIQLLEMYGQFKYYDVFMLLLNYLQSVNIEDVAGKSVTAWDEVDENDNIIVPGTSFEIHYEEPPVPEMVTTIPDEVMEEMIIETQQGHPLGLDWLDITLAERGLL